MSFGLTVVGTSARLSIALAIASVCAHSLVFAADTESGNQPPGALVAAVRSELSSEGPWASGRILVAPNTGLGAADFDKILASHGARSIGKLGVNDVHVVELPVVAHGHEAALARGLGQNPHIKFAEVDALMAPSLTTNDPNYAKEWHLPKINAPAAWDGSTGSGVTIAILDTGVNGGHPDLVAQMVPGWNFYDNNSNTSDVAGHGTLVAGAAAAASNNGIGVASVAGGARIMPVRISDPTGYAYWSTVAQGITWAADQGARVASLSYQGASSSSTIISAAQHLRSKGGVLITAAGNTGALDSTSPTPYITVVSATDQNDLRASWSTYGSFVDIAAPGVSIYTTTREGGYASASGTSLATPIVAATAALIIARRPSLGSAEIDSTLFSTALDIGSVGTDNYFGRGRVNAAAAVQQATSLSTTDTTPPSAVITSPTGGTVAGMIAIAVAASDNVGLARVDLRVNGVSIASDATSPFQFSWNSTSVPNGNATLTAVAFDVAGNSAVSAPVSISISNPVTADTTAPTVSIASPTGGTVSSTVTASVIASDNVGVARVDLRVNGVTVGSTNVSPYNVTWDSKSVSDGTASLTAVAYDAAGNSKTSSPVSVNVANSLTTTSDTVPPTLTVMNPKDGSTVAGNITISTVASDNSGSAGITQRLYIDGALNSTFSGGSLSYKWNTAKVAKGVHVLTISASDKVGNTTTAKVSVTK